MLNISSRTRGMTRVLQEFQCGCSHSSGSVEPLILKEQHTTHVKSHSARTCYHSNCGNIPHPARTIAMDAYTKQRRQNDLQESKLLDSITKNMQVIRERDVEIEKLINERSSQQGSSKLDDDAKAARIAFLKGENRKLWDMVSSLQFSLHKRTISFGETSCSSQNRVPSPELDHDYHIKPPAKSLKVALDPCDVLSKPSFMIHQGSTAPVQKPAENPRKCKRPRKQKDDPVPPLVSDLFDPPSKSLRKRSRNDSVKNIKLSEIHQPESTCPETEVVESSELTPEVDFAETKPERPEKSCKYGGFCQSNRADNCCWVSFEYPQRFDREYDPLYCKYSDEEMKLFKLHPTFRVSSVEPLNHHQRGSANDMTVESVRKRHEPYEMEEIRRKNWDDRRSRQIEEHDQLMSRQKCEIPDSLINPEKSFRRDVSEITECKVSESYPVMAFGANVPALKSEVFNLEWFDLKSYKYNSYSHRTILC